ncbi:hypothetical protein C1I97_25795 [Streptomyces sp. NTH33]|uniref:hypothetical protein n=1 Tax=Streptomyces sp. NTH33 TaxID=1735453 RepID=UPI000DA869CE|nr:hypothetical protein [Streptomyces sp. NTH33]PZG96862.1 hypothetical protein C1I97_25795 [Streptomyces sp. NTH33]
MDRSTCPHEVEFKPPESKGPWTSTGSADEKRRRDRACQSNGVTPRALNRSGSRKIPVGLDELNKEMVLENLVVFGSVNAGRRNYQQAADALAKADRSWLERLITL